QTLASITFQNYFRMYKKLAGMTGTAATEAAEFMHIYKLDVVEIPTNKPLIRTEYPDVIYRTAREKWNAVVEEIIELNKIGRPVLVGTISIEKSEKLSELLRKKNIKHVVLNAKYHELEAQIIAQAGRIGAVTIATNMAGRGVDILLGGNPDFLAKEALKKSRVDPLQATPEQYEKAYQEALKITSEEHQKVVALGGLHIIGTERHESRRIDNQLRGRAGRQGDPGSSRFYLSLEDDLMRIFGSDRLSGLMARIGMSEGVPIQHPMVTRAIERAQKQVEAQNFSIRKHLLEYDDVMNKQRETIYRQRREILEGKDQREYYLSLIDSLVEWYLDQYANQDKHPEDWDREALHQAIFAQFGYDLNQLNLNWEEITYDQLLERLTSALRSIYEQKEQLLGPENMRQFERLILLQVIDSRWKDHLLEMDYLKEGIGLRGYGQRDPLIEYKKESYEMFQQMLDRIEEDAVRYLFLIQPVAERERPAERRPQPMYYQRPQPSAAGGMRAKQARPLIPGKKRR
ncbi:MAG: preprotein translocase subunit SecA, partial [Candidatus Saccharicenans sp.]|nr:preprotein translocase subunit SecA [Candidatus Saccharicenans sp.]